MLVETITGGIFTLVLSDMPQTNTIEKQLYLFPTGRQLAKNLENVELRQLCFLSEVWVGENNEKYARAGDDPDRKEALMISILDIGNGKLIDRLCLFEIIRQGDTVTCYRSMKILIQFHNKMIQAFLVGISVIRFMIQKSNYFWHPLTWLHKTCLSYICDVPLLIIQKKIAYDSASDLLF